MSCNEEKAEIFVVVKMKVGFYVTLRTLDCMSTVYNYINYSYRKLYFHSYALQLGL
jgi:hypothetical protein